MLDPGKSSWLEKTKTFFGLDNDLPVHGSNSRNENGVKGIPVVDKWVALTVIWTLLFVFLMGFGVYNCRINSYVYNVSCYKSECSYKIEDKRMGLASLIQFQKGDLLDAEYVRIDEKGEYADSNKIRAQPKRYFGYSIKLKVRLPPEPNSRMKIERTIILAPYDMTRRSARAQAKKISDALLNENMDFDVTKSSSVTTLGILSITFGFLGLLLACIFGQWSEYNPRKLKKMS
jgi:hypothetical protein